MTRMSKEGGRQKEERHGHRFNLQKFEGDSIKPYLSVKQGYQKKKTPKSITRGL